MHGCIIHIDNGVDIAGSDGKTMRASAKAPTQSPRWLHFNPARGQVSSGGVVLETIVNGRPAHGPAERSFVNIIFAGCVDSSHISRIGLRSGHAQQLVLGISACIAVRVPGDGPISAVEPTYLSGPRWIVGSIAIDAA